MIYFSILQTIDDINYYTASVDTGPYKVTKDHCIRGQKIPTKEQGRHANKKTIQHLSTYDINTYFSVFP